MLLRDQRVFIKKEKKKVKVIVSHEKSPKVYVKAILTSFKSQ